MSWFKNAIDNLYGIVSAPVAARRDALLKRDVKHMFGREQAEQTDGLKDIKRMYGKARARGRTKEQRRFKTCLRRITNRS